MTKFLLCAENKNISNASFKVIDLKMNFYSRALKLIFTTEVLLLASF